MDQNSRVCEICYTFYGTKATNFLCSGCFKETKVNEVEEKPEPEEVAIPVAQEESKQEEVPEEDQSKVQVSR
jgi:hypothetical protein